MSRKQQETFDVYPEITIPILKFSVHVDQGEQFEGLDIRALYIAVQATKRKKIHNPPGYLSGILCKLMDEFLFNDL